jgi:hypothetical protein
MRIPVAPCSLGVRPSLCADCDALGIFPDVMQSGLNPAIFKALDLDVCLATIADSANRFKTLQDGFRQASRIGATSTTEDLEGQFTTLMRRTDDARSANPTIPDRHFTAAQKKIKGGDYDFDSVKKP